MANILSLNFWYDARANHLTLSSNKSFNEIQALNDTNRTIFTDRRTRENRRQQSLAMPSELDRRSGCRRSRRFDAKPWWLSINYAEELVSEKTDMEVEAELPSPIRQKKTKNNR